MGVTVVTGASGHVGANLILALLARGERPRALVHHDRRALEGLEVETVGGDVEDLDSLRRAFEGAEVVYHTAAHISISMHEWKKLAAVNIVGTRNVVQACLACGVRRLIHFSSVDALSPRPLDRPVDESSPLVNSRRDMPYGRSKAAGERLVRKGLGRGLDAVILNPSAIIGPHDYRLGFPNAGILAVTNSRLPALIDGGFDWVDVRDVIAGALQAAARAPSGSRYILSGHWASLHDLAHLAQEISGIRVPPFTAPMWLARCCVPFARLLSPLTEGRPLVTSAALKTLTGNRTISHERATRELGYEPRPLKETLVDTTQWFKARGWLP